MVITSLAWVKRGYAKAITDMYEDMQDPRQLKEEMDIEEQQFDKEDKYNLKNYDNEEAVPTFVADYQDMVKTSKKAKQNVDEEKEEVEEEDGEGDVEYDEEKFPFMVEDDDEEKEDYVIRKSDALIVVAAAEQNYSNLEVYLYEEDKNERCLIIWIKLKCSKASKIEWFTSININIISFIFSPCYDLTVWVSLQIYCPVLVLWNTKKTENDFSTTYNPCQHRW